MTILRCAFEGVDDWSRCLIKTERGTTLCDISCTDAEKIKADPSLGDWHTVTSDWGEPISRIKSDITIEITN